MMMKTRRYIQSLHYRNNILTFKCQFICGNWLVEDILYHVLSVKISFHKLNIIYTEMSTPVKLQGTGLEDVRIPGQTFLRDALTSCTDPLKAIETFQVPFEHSFRSKYF